MSQEREVVASAGTPIPSQVARGIKDDHFRELDATAAEAPVKMTADRAERKARLARVLERSAVQDRLAVALPANMHGEWVRNDVSEIHRMQTLGFEIDREFAVNNGLHGGTGNEAVIGDVIFMTTGKENKEMIDEIRHDKFMKQNGKRREEEEFKRSTRAGTDGEITPIIEGSEAPLTREGLASAVNGMNSQTSIS